MVDVLGKEDKVCVSIKGMVPGSLRVQGGTCTSQSLWEEGQRRLRRGGGWGWSLRRTFRRQEDKVQDRLGGRDDWEIPQDTAANVCWFILDTELHAAQIVLEIVI